MRHRDVADGRYWLAMAAIFLAGATIIVLLDGYHRSELQLHSERQLSQAAAQASQQLSHNMEQRIAAVEDLRAFMLAGSEFPEFEAFDRFASNLRDHYPSINALVYVDPDLIIRHIYPIQGHEKALGHDLKHRPSAPVIRKAIHEGRLVVDKPHRIIGGQKALIARAPLYRNGQFLGLAQGVFVISEILADDLRAIAKRYEIQLTDSDGNTFWNTTEEFPEQQQTEIVKFDGNTWILTLAYRAGSDASGFVPILIRLGGALWVLLLLYIVHRHWAEKRRLTETVTEKTRELQLRNSELESEIRQRQTTEASLRLSESRLNEAQRIANLGSWEWDSASGRIVWSNQLHRIFGINPGRVSFSLAEFLKRVHPDDRERTRQRIRAAEDEFEYECRIVRSDGTVRHLLAQGTLTRDSAGRPIRLAGIARDVTDQTHTALALRDSERKNDILMEHAGDGIAIADLDGHLLDANRRLLELLGYTREEFRALHARDITIPGEAQQVETAYGNIAAKGHSLDTQTLRRKGGTTFPAEIAGATVEWDGRTVVLSIFRDISERKRLEEALYRYQNDLEHLVDRRTEDLLIANRELEAFSYSVSHDLRGPLRAINGFSQILEEDCGHYLDSLGHGYIEKICKATERMARLIDDLLELSQTIRADLHHDAIDLSAVVEEISLELRSAEPDRRVRFDIQQGLAAMADSVLIRALLDNLMRNAWKFTREREEAIIEFGATDSDGETAFYVKDNGIGIDMSEASALFQPFHRLHGPNEYEGSGIGLATVQRIVQRHGGRVWFESEPGQGATFFFSLGHHEATASIPIPPLAKWTGS